MKYIIIITVLLVSSSICSVYAQKDTVAFKGDVALNGRMQTGNLSQLGLSPIANGWIGNQTSSLEAQALYQYLKVGGFNAVNDFWTRAVYRYKSDRTVFPVVAAYYGFAKSYKINNSFLGGVGAGVNVYKKSPTNYLQVHFVTGYFDINFDSLVRYRSHTLASIIKSVFPIDKKVSISWELQTYHPGLSGEYWGGSNMLMLRYKIAKGLSVNLSHRTQYNNKLVPGTKKTNTIMMWGIQYVFNNYQ